jgi:hypothetical protein
MHSAWGCESAVTDYSVFRKPDIVVRLRAVKRAAGLCGEAADEIERLRAALRLAERALDLRGPGWPLDEVRAALNAEGKP